MIKEGKVKTYDMGGKNTTLEVAKEVAKYAADQLAIRQTTDNTDEDARAADRSGSKPTRLRVVAETSATTGRTSFVSVGRHASVGVACAAFLVW